MSKSPHVSIDYINEDSFIKSNYDMEKLEIVCELQFSFITFFAKYKILDKVYVNKTIYVECDKERELYEKLENIPSRMQCEEFMKTMLVNEVNNKANLYGYILWVVFKENNIKKMFEKNINNTLEFIQNEINYLGQKLFNIIN